MNKIRRWILGTALVGLTLALVGQAPAQYSPSGSQTVWTQSTNLMPAVSTNYPATLTFTNVTVNADNQNDVCVSAAVTYQMSAASPVLGDMQFVFGPGDGTYYVTSTNVMSRCFVLTVPGFTMTTNTPVVGITNFNLGGVPKLRLIEVRSASTNLYATNITLRAFRKATASRLVP